MHPLHPAFHTPQPPLRCGAGVVPLVPLVQHSAPWQVAKPSPAFHQRVASEPQVAELQGLQALLGTCQHAPPGLVTTKTKPGWELVGYVLQGALLAPTHGAPPTSASVGAHVGLGAPQVLPVAAVHGMRHELPEACSLLLPRLCAHDQATLLPHHALAQLGLGLAQVLHQVLTATARWTQLPP